MTSNEYRKLVKEYKETDSISKKRELKTKILNSLVALTKDLEHLYNKYGTSFVDDSDWIEDKGGYELSDADDFGAAYIRYSDHWAYGGSCDVSISIPIKLFDIEERKKKEEELRAEYIKNLKKSISEANDYIDKLLKDKEDMISELHSLENTSKL